MIEVLFAPLFIMEAKMKKTGFYIGRFQPLHVGHMSVISQMLEEVDHAVIGIGSAQEHHTVENPFTADERVAMLREALGDSIERCTIIRIKDIDNYPRWVGHVESLCPKFDIVWSGNRIVKQLFEDAGYKVLIPEYESIISASEIRTMMCNGGGWQRYVPEGVAHIIKDLKGVDRVRQLYSRRYTNPAPTADIIIEVYDNASGTEKLEGIVLIERKEKPFGWAIPGGHQEYGDSLEKTAVKEAEEETGLKVELVEQLGTYSDPARDPRGHRNSTVFIARAYGKPKAGSDAKNAEVFALDSLPEELAFDHGRIIADYIKRKGL